MGWMEVRCFVSSFPGSVLCWGVWGSGPGEEGQAPDRGQEWPLCCSQDWGEQSQLQGKLIFFISFKVGSDQTCQHLEIIFQSSFMIIADIQFRTSMSTPMLLVQDQYVNCDVNPVWNYEAHFPVEHPNGLSLQLEVVFSCHISPLIQYNRNYNSSKKIHRRLTFLFCFVYD